MNKLILRFGPWLLALGALLPASLARADGFTSYNGAVCVPVIADRDKVEVSGTLGILNRSTETATVVCPMNGFRIQDVRVRAYDRSSSADVVCTLRGMSSDGRLVQAPETRRTTGDTDELQTLDMNPLHGAYAESWTLTCKLPGLTASGFSYITSIRVYHF